jgi:glycosyltransferase involved in cell wall biosynthesis
MKICLVVSDFAPRLGGIATFNNDLAAGVSMHKEVGHVLVIALQGHERSVEQVSPTLTVRRMPLGTLLQTWRTLYKELSAAREYDVFHAPNVFPVGFFTLLICRFILRKPAVSTFYGTDVLARAGNFFTRRAKRFTVLHADATTTISYSTRKLAAAQYGVQEERFSVVYYPLPQHKERNVADIRATYGYVASDIIILTVATLVRRKGTEDLIRALKEVPDQAVKLLIVGDGPERPALEQLTKDLALDARVRFAGRVQDVDSFYHHADIFALTSYFDVAEGDIEGLGIVFLEAQQHSLPVIGTRSGGIPETFIDGGSGFLIAERDVSALAGKIKLLASDPDMRKRMGKQGQQFVTQRFGSAAIVEHYVGIYKKVVQVRSISNHGT